VYQAKTLPAGAIVWAERQAGVLSRAQLISFGLCDSQVARLVRQQALRRLDRGVYILGVLEPIWHQYAWAAVMLGGESARLIGASAAVFEGLVAPVLPIHLSVDVRSGLASRPWLTVFRQRPSSRPSGSLASPPRTLIEDTLLDLCAAATDDAAVIGFITLSVPRLTSPRRLRRALERRSRIAHRALISDIVAETAVGVESPLEYRWIKHVERPHRLPAPTRPYRTPSGAVADGAYEEFRVLLELDGRRYHDGERRFRDWRRDNLSSEDDWLTLRYGWHDAVVQACETAGNVYRVLRRRGYTGQFGRCKHC
jgi:Transcriptional regulator, AbiEi antitoxin